MKRLFIDDCVLPDPEVPLVALPDPLVPVPVEPVPAPDAPLPLPMRALVSMNCAPVDRLAPVCVPDALLPDPVLPDPVADDPELPVPLVPVLPPAMSAFCRHPVTVTVWPC